MRSIGSRRRFGLATSASAQNGYGGKHYAYVLALPHSLRHTLARKHVVSLKVSVKGTATYQYDDEGEDVNTVTYTSAFSFRGVDWSPHAGYNGVGCTRRRPDDRHLRAPRSEVRLS